MAPVLDAPVPPTRLLQVRQRLAGWGATAAAAFANAPENAAYGLIALAPLGAAFGPAAMALAMVGAAAANAAASLLGGGRLVNGPRASLALLTAALLSALLQNLGGDAATLPGRALALVAAALVAAGLLQAMFGLLRLGNIVKFTPYPVRLGLTSGVGLLLVLSALPVAFGHGFGAGGSAWAGPPHWGAAAVALCAIAVSWGAARARFRFPAALLGLGCAAVLHALWRHLDPGATLGPLVGTPALPADWLASLAAAAPGLTVSTSVLALLGSYAATVAVLSSLDTLLTSSIVDGRLRRSRDVNRELVAQGLANVAAAVVGGQAASPSVPRTLSLVLPQVEHRHAALGYAAVTLGLILLAPGLLATLPVSAVGGLLLGQGLQMLSSALWRTPADVWMHWRQRVSRSGYDKTQRHMLATQWAVMVAVALSALVFGLGFAVLIGASCAMLLFVRANMRDVVRRSWTGETRQSLKTRPPLIAEALRREGHRTVLLELEGSLFFGTADALRVRLQGLPDTVETLILDLHQINEIDVTAARILFELAEDRLSAGKRLLFAEWAEDDARRRAVEAVAGAWGRRHLHFTDNTDEALEQTEELLLQRLQLDRGAGEALPLAATMIARGLSPDELARLAAEVEAVHFASGQVLFRQGDAGDALFISLKGDIGLRLPGTRRRLASFAPGVTVGEMAMLAHATRSAEAVAESDVDALRLTVEAFDRLQAADPPLAAKLLTNIALHLADRVRMLTGDLSQWVVRSTAGRSAAPMASGAHGADDPESTIE